MIPDSQSVKRRYAYTGAQTNSFPVGNKLQPFRMDRYCDCEVRFNPSLLKREATKVLV